MQLAILVLQCIEYGLEFQVLEMLSIVYYETSLVTFGRSPQMKSWSLEENIHIRLMVSAAVRRVLLCICEPTHLYLLEYSSSKFHLSLQESFDSTLVWSETLYKPSIDRHIVFCLTYDGTSQQ